MGEWVAFVLLGAGLGEANTGGGGGTLIFEGEISAFFKAIIQPFLDYVLQRFQN